jgi:hypothetical protein
MNLRRLLVVIALALVGAGCFDDKGTIWQCLVACDATVTFTLARPLAGRQITIAVGEHTGNVERLDCQPGDASVACLPVPSRLVPTFDASGALTSLTLSGAAQGELDVQITVDGAPAAAGSFNYDAVTSVAPSCGPPDDLLDPAGVHDRRLSAVLKFAP